MNVFPRFASAGGLLIMLASLAPAPAQDNAVPNLPPDGGDIQLRGPVHEAFAQPADLKPEPGQAVPKQPPPPVPEEAPEERPDGANVQWIQGYWAWDPERNDFMWVSGTYRNAPVGRQWVPGHWVNSSEGWRWVPGFWAPEQQEQLQYSPEPPAPLQVEPNMAPPDDEHTWVPGIWVHRESRFVWRPGYWSPYRVGRVWTAARYSWSPSGYLFNDGYWDYPLEDRGLLFAPVYFDRPYWHTAGWCWRPSYVVNFGLLFDSCFTRRGSFHFHFGNFYGSGYGRYGYNPWFHGRGHYDPCFGYHRWHHHRHDGNWYGRQRQLYADRDAGRLAGPPRTLAQQNLIVNNKTIVKNVNNTTVVAPLSQAKSINKNVNLVKLTPGQADTQKALARRNQEITQIRGKADREHSKDTPKAGAKDSQRAALKLPPLVKGTETVRSLDTTPKGDSGKAGFRDALPKGVRAETPRNEIRKGDSTNTPARNTVPSVNSTPKITDGPFGGNGAKEVKPRNNDGQGTFKPRGDAPSTPRNLEIKPASPKVTIPSTPKPRSIEGTAPRIINSPNPSSGGGFKIESPRSQNVPRSQSVPRSFEAPRLAPSAPRNLSVPRSATPAPRMSAPSAPRASAPSRSSPAPSNAAPSQRNSGSQRSGKGKG